MKSELHPTQGRRIPQNVAPLQTQREQGQAESQNHIRERSCDISKAPEVPPNVSGLFERDPNLSYAMLHRLKKQKADSNKKVLTMSHNLSKKLRNVQDLADNSKVGFDTNGPSSPAGSSIRHLVMGRTLAKPFRLSRSNSRKNPRAGGPPVPLQFRAHRVPEYGSSVGA